MTIDVDLTLTTSTTTARVTYTDPDDAGTRFQSSTLEELAATSRAVLDVAVSLATTARRRHVHHDRDHPRPADALDALDRRAALPAPAETNGGLAIGLDRLERRSLAFLEETAATLGALAERLDELEHRLGTPLVLFGHRSGLYGDDRDLGHRSDGLTLLELARRALGIEELEARSAAIDDVSIDDAGLYVARIDDLAERVGALEVTADHNPPELATRIEELATTTDRRLAELTDRLDLLEQFPRAIAATTAELGAHVNRATTATEGQQRRTVDLGNRLRTEAHRLDGIEGRVTNIEDLVAEHLGRARPPVNPAGPIGQAIADLELAHVAHDAREEATGLVSDDVEAARHVLSIAADHLLVDLETCTLCAHALARGYLTDTASIETSFSHRYVPNEAAVTTAALEPDPPGPELLALIDAELEPLAAAIDHALEAELDGERARDAATAPDALDDGLVITDEDRAALDAELEERAAAPPEEARVRAGGIDPDDVYTIVEELRATGQAITGRAVADALHRPRLAGPIARMLDARGWRA